jgi:hypothetical protein
MKKSGNRGKDELAAAQHLLKPLTLRQNNFNYEFWLKSTGSVAVSMTFWWGSG